MNINNLKTLQFAAVVAASIALTNCGNSAVTSQATGWKINDSKGGFQYGNSFDGVKAPVGMVEIEGGTFTMGRIQEDVLGDWNNQPTQQYVNSFFMDETEVTNLMYNEYLSWIKAVYPPSESRYRNIYNAALPDTLVWRNHLSFTETLTNAYLRHPAYANYPVVGVSWVQANDFSKWRTDRVNELALEKAGYLKKGAKVNDAYGSNSFSTDAYLSAPSQSYGGNDSIVFRGKNNKATGQSGVYLKQESGLFTAEFRLPTEAEWEYAASVSRSQREYNNVQGRNKYPWGSNELRTNSRRTKGDYLANFKQNRGDYGGIAGWTSDKGEMTTAVKTFPANDWGLYDMAGNVAEWVADVYRPAVADDVNDINYFRGNVYSKKAIDANGNVVIVDESNIKYDTLPNGRLRPKALPGQVAKTSVEEKDLYLRRNINDKNSINYKDGDNLAGVTRNSQMYNAPLNVVDFDGQGNPIYQYDNNTRTTLINNHSRVYKGGSWKDRAYWLDPATRRYLDQNTATDFIGFRNAMTKIGTTKANRKKARG